MGNNQAPQEDVRNDLGLQLDDSGEGVGNEGSMCIGCSQKVGKNRELPKEDKGKA